MEELTTPQTPNLCEMLGEFREHPTDCHKFYKCIAGEEGVDYVEGTCGDLLFFNLVTKTCDLPENVLLNRPDCGVTGTTVVPLPETTTESEEVAPSK